MNNPILFIKDAGHGEIPPCPDALFRRGDVVAVRNTKRLAHFPREAVVANPLPPVPGARDATYILINEGDPQSYIAREKDLTPTGKTVEIGAVTREGAAA